MFDFSSQAPQIFTASIAAAGLLYTAGTIIANSLLNYLNKLENQRLKTVESEQDRDKIKNTAEQYRKDQNKISGIVNANVIIFLLSNLFMICFWGCNNFTPFLYISVFLYATGIGIMLVLAIYSVSLWKKTINADYFF